MNTFKFKNKNIITFIMFLIMCFFMIQKNITLSFAEDEEKKETSSESNFKPIDTSSMKPKTVPKDAEQIDLRNETYSRDTEFSGTAVITDFKNSNSYISNLFTLVKKICNIFLGLSIVLGIAGLTYLFVCLGIYSSNPEMRSITMRKILIVLTATALSTGLATFFNIIINFMAKK